jgi:hypothetical protein
MDALQAGGAGNWVKPKKNWLEPTSPDDVLNYSKKLQMYNHHSWTQYLYSF